MSAELLLERADELARLQRALEGVVATSRGALVLVAGEAGIGKTALVRAFCEGVEGRVLTGACDALHTPRPLGPLLDILPDHEGDAFAALADELRRRAPTVVVLEDLHWADEATLDLLRLLGRRIETLPALVVATYRDDGLQRAHPLRLVLGELPRVTRLAPPRLSREAVMGLAGVHGEALYARTAGNPFYVTEALEAGAEIPASVRDAVLARAARLPASARAVLDAVAIVPNRAELWLLEALTDGELEPCLASGMLRADRDAVAFRHEIARETLEETLPPDRRRALHRRALAVLEQRGDLARIAHHADAAGDADAVLRAAPAAGERAAALGAHREAAAQFARALRYARGDRAALLERRAYECYLTDDIDGAILARREALAEHERHGDRRAQGNTRRWLSRLAWFTGDNPTAEDEAQRAIELLQDSPGSELAMAYSNLSQLRMLGEDLVGAREWGERAIALAERLGDTEILVHALNNVGSAELLHGDGAAKLERSLALATEEEHVARARTNLGSAHVKRREYGLADRHLSAGIAFCQERDLDVWLLYMLGWQARSQLEQGRWDEAAVGAHEVVDHPRAAVPSRITPLVVLGKLRARRGDPGAWGLLDEAEALARRTGEPQRLVPVACARAEARWLGGEAERVGAETRAALPLASGWEAEELRAWRRRAGIEDGEAPDSPRVAAAPDPPGTAALPAPSAAAAPPAPPRTAAPPGPSAAAAAPDPPGATSPEAWEALGCPYEAALARFDRGDERSLRAALAALQALGAHATAAHVARALRELGVRDLRLGPRRTTRANPAGLTPREQEVLALVAEGLRNAQIAERLVLAPKTVDHHVSALLRKLSVQSRTEAVAEARKIGVLADVLGGSRT